MPKQNLARMAEDLDRDLRAIREILRQPLEAEVARGGLTGPQQSAMVALVNTDGLSLKELSAHLGLAHSTTSGIIDRLQKRGLVKREENPDDRRLSRIVVTKEVREFIRDTMPKLSVHPLVAALERVKPGERETIANGLKLLLRALDAGPAGGG